MPYRRITLDQLPPAMLAGGGEPFSVRDRLEETEHNVEDLLLCLQALRADDVPSISWNWDENAWHPDSPSDEHYPQYFSRDINHDNIECHVIWSAPLCRRDPTRQWHDGERYLQGLGRQVLLFDYQLQATMPGEQDSAAPPRLIHDSLTVVVGMYEETPLRRAFASESGNKIKVELQLLIKLMQWIDELKDYLRLEKQALAALERRAKRHADLNLHSNE